MATPITPTPRQGSWVEMDEWDGSGNQPQPRQGSWVEMDVYPESGPWTPQTRQGSWVRMDPIYAPLRVRVDGEFGWADSNIKVNGAFVPGEISEVI